MSLADWQNLHESVVIDQYYGAPVPLPSPAQLDQFEAKSGFRLPRSYREFLLVFGPGTFRDSLKVAAPGYPRANSSFDLMRAHEAYRATKDELAYIAEPDRARADRLLYFALIDARDWLGWDLEDIRDSTDFEYGIYLRSNFCVDFVAASFQQLVQEHCDRIFAPDPDYIEEECGPQRVFYRGA